MSATCDGVRVVSVYVPNGREPDSEHYRYKLEWLASLRKMVAAGPEATIVCGDMNIAPTDDDVFDPDAYASQTHVTPPERDALTELESVGLHDVVRDRWPDSRCSRTGTTGPACSTRTSACGSTWCSRATRWRVRVEAAWVDRQARKGSGPSDHAPVIVDLDEAPDGESGQSCRRPTRSRSAAPEAPQAPTP